MNDSTIQGSFDDVWDEVMAELVSDPENWPAARALYGFEIGGNAGTMPYIAREGAEFDLQSGVLNPNIRGLVISIHGQYESSWVIPAVRYFDFATATAIAADYDPNFESRFAWDEWAVVAPLFQQTDFRPADDVLDDCKYWKSRWNVGDRSTDISGTFERSSFEILDRMIEAALDKYPNVEQVVVVGQSGGGQCVHRYACLDTGLLHSLADRPGLTLRLVGVNAGSYTFPTALRLIPKNLDSIDPDVDPKDDMGLVLLEWKIPVGCAGYDDFKWGMAGVSGAALNNSRGQQAYDWMRQWVLDQTEGGDFPPGWDWVRPLLTKAVSVLPVYALQVASDIEVADSGFSCKSIQQGWSRALRWYSCKRAWEEMALIKLPQTRLKFRQILPDGGQNAGWVIEKHGASALLSHETRLAMGLYLWN